MRRSKGQRGCDMERKTDCQWFRDLRCSIDQPPVLSHTVRQGSALAAKRHNPGTIHAEPRSSEPFPPLELNNVQNACNRG
jgi:hypothetical protein